MFQKAQKLKKYLKVMVYGKSGTGKTHLALTFPKCAVIDTESGTDFFIDRVEEFNVMKTMSYKDIKEAAEKLAKKTDGNETLVIDSITNVYNNLKDSIQDVIEKRAMKSNKPVDEAGYTQRDWGTLKNKFKIMMTDLYNLPMNVVITAWEKPLYEGQGDNLKQIGVTFEADKSFDYQPDIVIHLVVDAKGNRTGIVEKDRTGTFKTQERIPNPSFENFKVILDKFNGGKLGTTPDVKQSMDKDVKDLMGNNEESTLKTAFISKAKEAGINPVEFIVKRLNRNPKELPPTVEEYKLLISEVEDLMTNVLIEKHYCEACNAEITEDRKFSSFEKTCKCLCEACEAKEEK